MENITSSTISFIHILSLIIAMVTGMYVLTTTKGTKRHKKIGYVYAISMIILNVTAFMIYKLFGKFGIFHWFAVLSSVTLILGMYPILVKKSKNYIYHHFNFMYWSVAGLYCAFFAEIFTRIPFILEMPNSRQLFGILTGVSTLLVMIIAAIIFAKMKPLWLNQFQQK